MRTATTKIRVDSRVVRVAIDANASAPRALHSAEAGSTCCSCAQFWRSFGRGCNCSLLLSRSLCFFGRQEMKFNRMLKPAEELHVSCLMFRRRVESTGKLHPTMSWCTCGSQFSVCALLSNLCDRSVRSSLKVRTAPSRSGTA